MLFLGDFCASLTPPGEMTFRVDISIAPGPQGLGGVSVLTRSELKGTLAIALDCYFS